MKKQVLGLFLFLLLSFGASRALAAPGFVDVPSDHPQFLAIQFFTEKGVVEGYPDGFFRPGRLLNRTEAFQIISHPFLGGFPDDFFWGTEKVTHEEALNLIREIGKLPEGVKKHPGERISRGEFLGLLYQSFLNKNREAEPAKSVSPIRKVKKDSPLQNAIYRIVGYLTPGGRFIATGQEIDSTGAHTPSGGGGGGAPVAVISGGGGGGNETGGNTGGGGTGGGGSGGGGTGGSDGGNGGGGGGSGGGGGGTGGGGGGGGGTGGGGDTGGGGGSGGGGGGSGGGGGGQTGGGGTGNLILPPQNFKVAFVGDTGRWDNFEAVLQLIRQEGTDLVLHQGDLAYDEGNSNAPRLWMNVIDQELGSSFPYLFSMGNHDVRHWNDVGGYRDLLTAQFAELSVIPRGNAALLGAMTGFDYQGIGVTQVAPGENQNAAGTGHADFIDQELTNNNHLWTICGWHKNMRAMQIGGKGDEAGWEVYEKCLENGAIIATAHEHSYERTHVLSNVRAQTVADNTSPYTIQPGQTFVFVSGIGGSSIRNQQRCFPSTSPYGCNGEWASIYTEDQGANYGALFIEFYVDGDPRKARGYFKDIDGNIVDSFEIINNKGATGGTGDGSGDTGDGTGGGGGGGGTNPAGFVSAQGDQLMLNGQPFRFTGVNAYGAANNELYSCGPHADSGDEPEAYLDAMFQTLSSRGIDAVRFWAFQAFSGPSGMDFSALRRVIDKAEQYGMFVIPTLENQWDHCPENIFKDPAWYQGGYAEPYGNYALGYDDYLRAVVNEFKDEPSILMWQLLNEAESEDATALYNFTRDMSALIKSIDQNHLVNLGTLGTGQPGTANENFVALHSLSTIDVVEAHDYNDVTLAWPDEGSNNIDRDYQVAQSLQKPFFIGEAGINLGSYSMEERAALFDAKLRAAFLDHEVGGYLIWEWDNLPEDFGRSGCGGNCFTEGDPLLDLLAQYPGGPAPAPTVPLVLPELIPSATETIPETQQEPIPVPPIPEAEPETPMGESEFPQEEPETVPELEAVPEAEPEAESEEGSDPEAVPIIIPADLPPARPEEITEPEGENLPPETND